MGVEENILKGLAGNVNTKKEKRTFVFLLQ